VVRLTQFPFLHQRRIIASCFISTFIQHVDLSQLVKVQCQYSSVLHHPLFPFPFFPIEQILMFSFYSSQTFNRPNLLGLESNDQSNVFIDDTHVSSFFLPTDQFLQYPETPEWTIRLGTELSSQFLHPSKSPFLILPPPSTFIPYLVYVSRWSNPREFSYLVFVPISIDFSLLLKVFGLYNTKAADVNTVPYDCQRASSFYRQMSTTNVCVRNSPWSTASNFTHVNPKRTWITKTKLFFFSNPPQLRRRGVNFFITVKGRKLPSGIISEIGPWGGLWRHGPSIAGPWGYRCFTEWDQVYVYCIRSLNGTDVCILLYSFLNGSIQLQVGHDDVFGCSHSKVQPKSCIPYTHRNKRKWADSISLSYKRKQVYLKIGPPIIAHFQIQPSPCARLDGTGRG